MQRILRNLKSWADSHRFEVVWLLTVVALALAVIVYLNIQHARTLTEIQAALDSQCGSGGYMVSEGNYDVDPIDYWGSSEASCLRSSSHEGFICSC